MSQQLGRAPTAAELAEHLDMTRDEVAEAISAHGSYQPASLDESLGAGDDSALVDILGVIDGELDRVEVRSLVGSLVRDLPERERTMLALRFVHEKTQAEIAAVLCISQMHVSRLLSRTLAALRDQIERETPRSSWSRSGAAGRPDTSAVPMATTPLPARELSAWHDPEHAEEPDTYPALRDDRRVDVAVVGAGITGLTTAVLLAREGLQVAVLEARRVGAVATGNTTAKISVLQGTRAATLDHRHSQATVDAYLAAHRAGFDWLLDRARRADCDLERRPAVTFATSGRSSAAAETVRREAAVLRRAGFPAQLGTEVGLPLEVSEAVTLADQAQFDPMPYLADLAQELHESGHLVYEHTRVRSVSLLGAPRLRTEHGDVRAERVVPRFRPERDCTGLRISTAARCRRRRS